MRTIHWDSCSAALCKDMSEQEKKDVAWYPGEELCVGEPYTLFQKEQIRINKLYTKGSKKYRAPNLTFTAKQLETTKRKRIESARRRFDLSNLRPYTKRSN